MKKLAWMLVLLMIAACVLPACSGSDTAAAKAEATEAVTEVAAESATETEAVEETEGAQWPRVYVDANGNEVEIAEKPMKIALMSFHHYEALLVLDAPLYAATAINVYTGWETLKPYAEKTELIDLGDNQSPNLEKLAECEPDLILAGAGTHDEIAESLNKIAPTIYVGRSGNFGTWQGMVREFGKILGEEALAEERIAELETLISTSRDQLSVHADKTVAMVRLMEKEVKYWTPDFVYNQEGGLGLISAFAEGEGERAGTVVSYEGLVELNPDYIFIYEDALTEDDETMLASVEGTALWESLNAVKNGNVHILDRSVFSGGPLAMELGTNAIVAAMMAE